MGTRGDELLGTWRTRSVAGDDTPDGVESKITFVVTDDGERRVHGRGGVNTFGGGFDVDGGEVVLGPFFTTLMAGPEPAGRHESALLAALSGRRPFRIERGEVLVVGEGDHEVVFDRVETVEISGSVTYRERTALPIGAVVSVRLHDVSRADATADAIGQSVVEPDHQVPIPFSLTAERAAFDDRRTYSLSARISIDGELRWISDTHNPVSLDRLTGIEIVVRRVSGA